MKSLTVVVGIIVVHTPNVDVEDGLTNGATGVMKHIDFRMEGTNRPSIIWVLFDEPHVGRTTREKYRKLYNSTIHTDWTPVFDTQRTFILNYKTYQRFHFPLTPVSGESRLCRRDENVHFALKRFRLIRLDDTEKESVKTSSWTCPVCK